MDNLYIAFQATRCIAAGDLATVAAAAKSAADQGGAGLLIFNDQTSQPVDLDLRGDLAAVLARLPAAPQSDEARRGPGRPKLGVVAREVTLLPRHWQWLADQPGGASVALRKLVEAARKGGDDKAALRYAQEAAYRFMSAMAGDLPGFEEASRALFAGEAARFEALAQAWPADVAAHARRLAQRVWEGCGSGDPEPGGQAEAS